MEYTLTMRTDILVDEDGRAHTVYGVNAIDRNGAVWAFPDISFERETVQRLMRLCEQEEVAWCHLENVVQDIIEEQYLVL